MTLKEKLQKKLTMERAGVISFSLAYCDDQIGKAELYRKVWSYRDAVEEYEAAKKRRWRQK